MPLPTPPMRLTPPAPAALLLLPPNNMVVKKQEVKSCARPDPADLMGSARQFINDRAEVDPSTTASNDEGMDDPDSTEAQIRSADVRDYDMADVQEDNEARWRARAQYQLPPLVLPDKSHAADAYTLPSIHAAFPAFSLPLDDAPVPARHRTPLFLPGTRDPTPFTAHDPQEITPFQFPPVPQAGPSAQTVVSTSSMLWTPSDDGDVASTSSMFWSSDDGDDGDVASTSSMFWTPSDDGDTAPPTTSSSAADDSAFGSGTSSPSTSRPASPPPRRVRVHDEARTQHINAYFDLMAGESDSDGQDMDENMEEDAPDDDDMATKKHLGCCPRTTITMPRTYKKLQMTMRLPENPVLRQNIKDLLPIPSLYEPPPPHDAPPPPSGKQKKQEVKIPPPLHPHALETARQTQHHIHTNLPRPEPDAVVTPGPRRQTQSDARFDDHDNRWERLRNVKPAFFQKNYRVVTPTINEVRPFRSCRRHELLKISFASPSQALEPGNRAVCWKGRHAGEEGYLLNFGLYRTQMGQEYFPIKIVPTLATGVYGDEVQGFWILSSNLRRHILCPSPTLRIHDRVRVNEGNEFRNCVGWVTNIEDYMVTISGCTNPEGPKPEGLMANDTIVIEMKFINRDFQRGDLVVVIRGEHKSRQGLIVTRHRGGVLEIYGGPTHPGGADDEDVAARNFSEQMSTSCLLTMSSSRDGHGTFEHGSKPAGFGPAGLGAKFAVGDSSVSISSTKLDRTITHDEKPVSIPIFKHSAPYTAQSHVPHPNVPIARPAFTPTDAFLGKEADWQSYEADELAQQAVFDKIVEIAPPASLAALRAALDEINDKQTSLKHVGKRYEGIFVRVIGLKQENSAEKGRRGMVVGDYDSRERSERLKRQNLKKRWNTRGDTRGIMVTIRDTSNRQFQVEIEKVAHEATGLPLSQALYLPRHILYAQKSATPLSLQPPARSPTPPPLEPTEDWTSNRFALTSPILEGEANGTWLCQPAFVGKQLDVIIVGIIGIVKTHYWSVSKTLINLEKKTGHLLFEDAHPARDIEKSKVQVYGVGKNGLAHKVPAIYIKPLREGVDGQPITKVAQRIVVVGGDIQLDMSAVGAYAETRPEIVHPHGEDVVAVRLEGGAGPFFFNILHLCRSTNTSLTLGTTNFPATTFV
ncbi:hypothetical protein FB451DRAFT_1163922 [Mycena latifolia]|nr:hypothetical protein FB451DRAFT_1163922 [Mycena latifolia]